MFFLNYFRYNFNSLALLICIIVSTAQSGIMEFGSQAYLPMPSTLVQKYFKVIRYIFLQLNRFRLLIRKPVPFPAQNKKIYYLLFNAQFKKALSVVTLSAHCSKIVISSTIAEATIYFKAHYWGNTACC